jgi:hypothetical protein
MGPAARVVAPSLLPRADSALGIMLVRLGMAEIGEQPVAHVLRDEAPVPFNQVSAAAVIGTDDVHEILRIKPTR